jgi:hypothetical protein
MILELFRHFITNRVLSDRLISPALETPLNRSISPEGRRVIVAPLNDLQERLALKTFIEALYWTSNGWLPIASVLAVLSTLW